MLQIFQWKILIKYARFIFHVCHIDSNEKINKNSNPWVCNPTWDYDQPSNWILIVYYRCRSSCICGSVNRIGVKMSSESELDRLVTAIAEGLNRDSGDKDIVLSALKRTPVNYLELLTGNTAFLKDFILIETPTDPNAIQDLSKKELIFTTCRANFFEKIRMPVLTDDQLTPLLLRTYELWGEHPTEPRGRWTEWCLWTHLNRRQNGVPVTEVIAGTKTAEDMKQAWIERHQLREEQRRLQKVDHYDQYETSEDVPRSLRHILMSPFLKEPNVTKVEIQLDDSVVEDNKQRQEK